MTEQDFVEARDVYARGQENLADMQNKMNVSSFDTDAQWLACGPGNSFCGGALKSAYQDVMKSDSCAVETHIAENDQMYDYVMWRPSYASDLKRGSAFLNASVDTNRFAAKQVTQESFLQGRGQVTSNPGCKGGFVNYLPQSVFGDQPATREAWDMHLFSQPTLVPRSCASLTELDLTQRMKPLAGAYQGRYNPLLGDETYASRSGTKYAEGVTLSTKKYVDFAALAAEGKYLA